MKIVCLGWGSLIWKPGELRCIGDWQADGPELPIEFSRTSRDGRLTLVLTPGASPVPTFWVEVAYDTPVLAQAALAKREGSPTHAIGLSPGPVPRHSLGSDVIAAWAGAKGFDAVIWTALGPKFSGQDGLAPDSPAAAISYVLRLDAEAFAKAKEYVICAPAQIKTPIRSALETDLGWVQSTVRS